MMHIRNIYILKSTLQYVYVTNMHYTVSQFETLRGSRTEVRDPSKRFEFWSTGPSKRFELWDLFHPWVDSRVLHLDRRVLHLDAKKWGGVHQMHTAHAAFGVHQMASDGIRCTPPTPPLVCIRWHQMHTAHAAFGVHQMASDACRPRRLYRCTDAHRPQPIFFKGRCASRHPIFLKAARSMRN